MFLICSITEKKEINLEIEWASWKRKTNWRGPFADGNLCTTWQGLQNIAAADSFCICKPIQFGSTSTTSPIDDLDAFYFYQVREGAIGPSYDQSLPHSELPTLSLSSVQQRWLEASKMSKTYLKILTHDGFPWWFFFNALSGILLELLLLVCGSLWLKLCLKHMKRILLMFRTPDISFFQGQDEVYLPFNGPLMLKPCWFPTTASIFRFSPGMNTGLFITLQIS